MLRSSPMRTHLRSKVCACVAMGIVGQERRIRLSAHAARLRIAFKSWNVLQFLVMRKGFVPPSIAISFPFCRLARPIWVRHTSVHETRVQDIRCWCDRKNIGMAYRFDKNFVRVFSWAVTTLITRQVPPGRPSASRGALQRAVPPSAEAV